MLKSLYYVILNCVAFFLLSLAIYSDDAIRIDDSFKELDISNRIYIFEDAAKNRNLKIEDLKEENFRQYRESNLPPSFGYKDADYWVKFRISDDRTNKEKIVLAVEYPSWDRITLFTIQEGKLVSYTTGDMQRFSNRQLFHRNFAFMIQPDGNDIFLKFESEGSKPFPLVLYSVPEYIRNVDYSNYGYGLYYGIIIVMLLYNLFLYFSIRDESYLYYVMFLFSFLAVQMTIDGTSFQFIWPEWPVLGNLAMPYTMLLTMILAIFFTNSFLRIKENSPKFLILFRVLLAYGLTVMAVAPLMRYNVIIKLSIALQMAMPLASLTAGIYMWKMGYRAAKFFVSAWSILLLASVIVALKHSGFLPINFATNHSQKIGSVLEVILLSLALADKISIMKEEKDVIQQKALDAQKKLVASYARFVPEQLLTFLGKDIITEIRLGDAIEKEMTILFSDIRSFTTISESMTPDENFGFINSYMAAMGPCIRKHSGFIDKYIGDAIMALFPLKASDAIDAAIDMLEELHRLNLKRKEKGFQPISIGIGIHTGSQMLGIIGEKERLEGTVISDVVNTASRLESLTKSYASSLLVSMDVMSRIENKDIYHYRHLDTVKVKGKNKAVQILEILNGNSQRIIDLKLRTKRLFESGIDHYFRKEFISAEKCFSEVLKEDPRDKAAELYIERCRLYQSKGITPDWDGAEKLDFK